MNYNNNNKCNNYEICNECKIKTWIGQLVKLENWPEKGALCRDCLIKIKIPCCNCSKFFNKIENFTEYEKKNYEQHEKVDRKKWNETNPAGEIFWPYIGCHYYGKGGQFCHQRDCRGHFVPQHGHFCSQECYDDWNGTINYDSQKYLEWKKAVEKQGWTPCQEKDIFASYWDWFFNRFPKYRNESRIIKTKELMLQKVKEKGESSECKGMAAPNEKYCEYCKEEKVPGYKTNPEKNWVKNYRDYYNLTDRKDNSENNSEISSVSASDNNDKNSDSEIEKLTKKLIEAKKGGKSPEETEKEIQELKNELDKLNGKNQPTEEKPTKNNNKVWAWSGVAVISILIAGLFYISRKKKKNK
ncbi:MAG: hypothetical protein I3273_07220 [Candidatus Moeniiplasma glomeromycotorum]|nr:hypothetical protein [Candidatus Moeniiplasma glomeromycotorum]MCE8168326.1 hypothetical protein [Candidatus Moeniiplasma glomeromycotorum]MCE8169876.1 hypothetical protein [Candidatus Moeniiplasma glomeromycotorum]